MGQLLVFNKRFWTTIKKINIIKAITSKLKFSFAD